MNIADIYEAIAWEHPDFVAQEQGDRFFSWRDFDERSTAIANELLRAGLSVQSKVAQYLYNCPEYLESTNAILKARCVPVNTNYRYGADELKYLWGDADIEAVIFDARFSEVCNRLRSSMPNTRVWIRVGDHDVSAEWCASYSQIIEGGRGERLQLASKRSNEDLFIMYTGGTTGMPRGVMWTQDDLFRYLELQNKRTYPPDIAADVYARAIEKPGPKVLPGPPLMHGAGAWFSMSNLNRAGSVVTLSDWRFDPAQLLDTISKHSVQGLAIVGDAFAKPLINVLSNEPSRWDLETLRVIVSSGTMLSQQSKDRLLQFLPLAIIVDALGSSETGGIASSVSDSTNIADTGRFRLRTGARAIDEEGRDLVPGSGNLGRLVVQGYIPLGYYKDVEKTRESFITVDGERYALTGDWVTLDADGSVNLVGRGSGCINTGGEKVFAEEVESVLKTHPQIEDAVVVGVPDDRFGQAVVALVESDGEPDEEDVKSFTRNSLSAYKCPKRVFRVDSLGRSSSGKVDHRALSSLGATLASVQAK